MVVRRAILKLLVNKRTRFTNTIVNGGLVLIILTGILVYKSTDYISTKVSGIPLCQNRLTSSIPLDDFTDYPCLDDQRSNEIIGGCVRTVCREKNKAWSFLKECQILTKVNAEICTYDPKDDEIADVIQKNGVWEGHLVNNMLETFNRHPELVFLDIGCNIGVYTISAAARKTKAICVDANPENLRLVSKSVARGGFKDYVTIVWNALSNQRHRVNLQIIAGNAGASRIDDISKFNMTKKKDIAVNTILLDDLQRLVPRGKQLFIKLDAEAHELYVLKGAAAFFRNIDVRILQMELLEEDTFNDVVDHMNNLGFLMFRDPIGKQLLEKKEFVSGNWPGDVYFIKKEYL